MGIIELFLRLVITIVGVFVGNFIYERFKFLDCTSKSNEHKCSASKRNGRK